MMEGPPPMEDAEKKEVEFTTPEEIDDLRVYFTSLQKCLIRTREILARNDLDEPTRRRYEEDLINLEVEYNTQALPYLESIGDIVPEGS